ncbi:hypothetical protein FNF29_02795 [Cafeteria roenbergensis]|uniref:GOLD domain-containing protein n=1 Tax=Cafeteria roenbergensis TaxID=33653 RepID=A0A5A8CL43_CAFRO|nr:hypothetical protein FNF29_02795 [Cafeteria roenbergensis]|eukprot:KAA0153806.1 hypothetical protein FNF29_02795 [Cafeteria roenbergensis]
MVRISLACTAAAALVVLFPALGTGADPAELGSGAQEAIREASSPGGTADGEPGGTGPVLGAVHGGHAPGGGRGPGEVREEADPPAADVNPEGGQSNRQSSDKTAPQHDVERAGGADAVFQPSNLLTLPLAAGETVSLFEDIGPDREGWVVRGGFAVATTGDATATVRVTGSWGQTVWEGRGRQSGTWAFKAQRGTLEVQITNSNPGLAVMTLGWVVGGDKDNAFAQQSDRGESASGGGATVDLESGPRISALMDSMTRATAAVHASMDAAQARMQTNAVWMRHNHQTAESTAWRINVWKGTEAVAVLALAILQVWFITSVARTSLASFEDPRRRTHKVMSSRFAPRGMV